MEQTRPQAPNALCSQVLSLKMCHNSLPQGGSPDDCETLVPKEDRASI